MNCECCGAPADGRLVLCTFCKKPISEELLRAAIPCPQCKTPNVHGSERCVHCNAWVVVKCVFCGALSPHTEPACLSCHEAFAGAPERKAARDAEAQRQQQLQVISTVGSVAAPILGAVAGSLLGSVLGSHHSSDGGSIFSGSIDAVPQGHDAGGGGIFEAASSIFGDSSGGSDNSDK